MDIALLLLVTPATPTALNMLKIALLFGIGFPAPSICLLLKTYTNTYTFFADQKITNSNLLIYLGWLPTLRTISANS